MEMKVKFAGLESLMEEDLANDMMMNQAAPSSPVSVFKGEIHPRPQKGKKQEEEGAMEVVEEREKEKEGRRKSTPPVAIISADDNDEQQKDPPFVLPQQQQMYVPTTMLPVVVGKEQTSHLPPLVLPHPSAVVVKAKELANKLSNMDIVENKKENQKENEVSASQESANLQFSQPLTTTMDAEMKVICYEIKRFM
jgi:hypothetical protein